MSALVCVQCGEPVDSLYIEYSPTNIRLTRCSKCGKVADKYVEYELLLVVTDAVLHKRPAVRHLLFNRLSENSLQKTMRWVPVSCLGLHMALRASVLHSTAYTTMFSVTTMIHSLLGCALDQAVLIAACACALYATPAARQALQKVNKSLTKVYLTLVAPELLRGFALLLQMFDTEVAPLVLFALLILSLQMLALQCLTGLRTAKLVACAATIAFARAALKLLLFHRADCARLGYLA